LRLAFFLLNNCIFFTVVNLRGSDDWRRSTQNSYVNNSVKCIGANGKYATLPLQCPNKYFNWWNYYWNVT